MIFGLLVFAFIAGLGLLAAFVPVGHGFVPKGGGWFRPEVVGGQFTLHPLLIAVPWAACFVLGLVDWHRPWRVEHLDCWRSPVMFAYLLYPFTDLSLTAETNDALIAALCVWAIVAAQRPVTRGLLIAAAAVTKFVPALLAFQFLGVKRGRSRYVLTLAAALAGMLAWPLITSGVMQFLDSTVGYQLTQRGG